MGADVKHAVAEAEEDQRVVAIVLTGAGRGFCAGADLKGLDSISGGYALNEAMFRLTVPPGTLSLFREKESQDGKQEVTKPRGFGPAAQSVGTDPGV